MEQLQGEALAAGTPRFLIVTGMSGGGKSTAIHLLEDAGFYCVDNLPPSLIAPFAELAMRPGSDLERVALGIDARSGSQFEEVPGAIEGLKERGLSVEILFMDCDDAVLVKRYKETRRNHPMQLFSSGGRLEDGIRKERELLAGIRGEADVVIDSSHLLTRELRDELSRVLLHEEQHHNLMVTILSFGFKHGIPTDADLVFDVRFLPNPFYVEELKLLTGPDAPVREYVTGDPDCAVFLDKLTDLMRFLIPGYIREGKNQLVIAVGCTGGQHRSVTIAQALYERLHALGGFGIKIAHRDCHANVDEVKNRYATGAVR